MLSLHWHGNCRKSKEEIAKALQSNRRQDFLFALQQEFEMYKMLQKKIIECDVAINNLLNEQLGNDENKKGLKAPKKYINALIKTHRSIWTSINWLINTSLV